MNEKQIKELIQEVLRTNDTSNQYGFPAVPFHIHNGIDSARVSASNLDFSNWGIWGTVTTDGAGTATITHPNIITTSIVLLTPQAIFAEGTSSFGANLSPTNNSVTISSTGITYQSCLFFYLVIFNPTPA